MKMMKILVASLSMLTLVSCSGWLDSTPKGVMDEEKFFQSPDAGYKTVVKCYSTLRGAFEYEIPRLIFNTCTDDAEKGGYDASDRSSALELSYGRPTTSNQDLTNFWKGMYAGIARCNLSLENIPVAPLVDLEGYPLTEEVKARYIAEVKALRAFFHFELSKIFGGVPCIDRTLTVADSKTLVRATEAETAEFIFKDLKEAAESEALPSHLDLPKNEIGRLTKEAVWALQAKIYMYYAKDNEDYLNDALAAAEKVVNAGFSLAPNYQDLFLPGSHNLSESIWAVIQGDEPSTYVYGSFVPVYCCPRSSGAYGFDQPTQNLVDEFEEGDPRLLYTVIQQGDKFPKSKGVEKLDFSTYPNTGYHSRKAYLIPERRGAGWGDDAWTFHQIRYADILLIYAEALVRTGGDMDKAVECINMVRERANNSRGGDVEAVKRVMEIPAKNIPMVSTGSQEELLEAIKHERRVELAMEYNRMYDLKRWNCYTETMNLFSTDPHSNGRGASFKKGVNEVFPIPQVEIDRTGGSIVQNPGY